VAARLDEVAGAATGPLAIIAHDAGLAQADGLLGRDFLSLFSVTIGARASVVTRRRRSGVTGSPSPSWPPRQSGDPGSP